MPSPTVFFCISSMCVFYWVPCHKNFTVKNDNFTFDQKTLNFTDLVELASLLYAGQPNDRLAVVKGLVEDGVRITLNVLSLPLGRFVVLLHLFPLHILQCLYGGVIGG